jgi:hypothetical protein
VSGLVKQPRKFVVLGVWRVWHTMPSDVARRRNVGRIPEAADTNDRAVRRLRRAGYGIVLRIGLVEEDESERIDRAGVYPPRRGGGPGG